MLIFQGLMSSGFSKLGADELLSKTELSLKGGVPQIIQIANTQYKELMLEADFSGKPPTISVVFFPRSSQGKELLLQYDARNGENYRILESGSLPSRVLADLSVGTVLMGAESVDIVLTTYFDKPQKFKFDGLPRFNKDDGTVRFTLEMYEPQRTTTTLYSMAGQRLCSSVDNLSQGLVDFNLAIPDANNLATQLLFLVVDLQDYGPIVKTINTAGGAR
jgi:hypothetical protein